MIEKTNKILNFFGVFSSSLFVAAVAVYVFSPVIGSHADSITAKVNTIVNPVASITLDDDNLEFNVAPTVEGAFSSDLITATVHTNSTGGYELYFSSDDDATDMVHSNPSVTSVVSSDFSGTLTSANMPVNSWGYSLDNTNFSKIPTATSAVAVRNIDHFPEENERVNTIYIGTKIANTLASGDYSKNVVFSVIAHETPEPPVPMQGYDGSGLSIGESVRLIDERDGNIYTAKKLADGNVWMTQNLGIVGKTITSEDSNLPDGESYTIPDSDVSAFPDYGETDEPNAAYYDSGYGGYYTFYTATAGWGSDDKGNDETSPKDICPKGWRLPTGASNFSPNDYRYLASVYDTLDLMNNEAKITLSGRIVNGNLSDQGAMGRYWSSTAYSNNGFSSYFGMDTSKVNNSNTIGIYGFSVRCILKDNRTINDISYMQEMNPNINNNTSINMVATLKDIRDGNSYYVRKAEDGNIWMTENLRIMGKEISHDDSDIPTGETYSIPSSDINSFTSSYDTSAAYLSQDSGGYYNFYTANAGWIGSENVVSSSKTGICPKGWRLPEAGNGYRDYSRLTKDYPGIVKGILGFDAVGHVENGEMKTDEAISMFWSSETSVYMDQAMALNVTSSTNINKLTKKYLGANVRCIAK